MKQLGNLAIVCAKRPEVLMQIYGGEVAVHVGAGPDHAVMFTTWDNDAEIARTKSLIFPDGMQMDVKCCGSKDAPSWTEGVLFDRRGNEVAHTDVFDEFEGKWELVHEGILYTMIIKMEGEPW